MRCKFLIHGLIVLLLAVQVAVAGDKATLPASTEKISKSEKTSEKTLASRIEKILAQPDIARGMWGIDVVSVANGNVLYEQNADKLFTPASNTKLFTTAAVWALIGPDYKFRTTVESTAALDKYGRLSGDLVLVGRGDPNLSGRVLPYNLRTERKLPPLSALEGLADQVVQKGVKFIDGDIVADDSYYAFERYGEGWAQDDLVWEWGAPVSALTVNDNVIFVSIMPADRAGERAFVSIVPYADYYRIDNRVVTTPPGTGPRKIYINREPGSNRLTLWGNIPSDDTGANEALAIEDSADFAAQAFRGMLEKRGIVIFGQSRARHNELANLNTLSVTTMAPAGGGDEKPPAMMRNTSTVLASYESQPLSDDLRVINKVSQNLHAELMLRLLGREKGTAGTIEGGLEVERGFLAGAGIKQDEYVFFDGSGLSRQNLVTPHAIVKLLAFAATQTWGELYLSTLPVASVDGSLGERFKGSVAAGRVIAKTGSLGHVNALSGYATTLRGERVAFSILANNHNLTSKRALETIDKIVEAIVEEGKK
jgi:D-alanyl-D-alanine carboxypeptidase/D-alanyl-D-alanine-endopeptidase (penicillin-binding protein 4)